jgi:hypothetical protein
MSVTAKLVGFLLILLAVVGAAVGIGRVVGPVDPDGPAGHATDAADTDTGESASDATAIPKGLMVSQGGYTFQLARTTASPGTSVPVSFTIEGPDGRPVTDYTVEHEEDLHLIAVRRDFTGFQHVHPEMAPDGTWTTALDLTPGAWRLFADFQAAGAEAVTLGNDLAVSGQFQPAAPAANSTTATVDGYTVTLDGDLAAGADAKLTLNVTRNGEPVTDLEPYLGAYGHLVALRAGDLAYLHVHPEGTPDDGVTEPGPQVGFSVKVPSSGRYHLFLDFKHQGVVRTAAFTVTGSGSAAPKEDADTSDGGHSGDEHSSVSPRRSR